MGPDSSNIFLVKCYGCSGWVRSLASDVVYTSEGHEAFTIQRWCLSCLNKVEERSEVILKEFNPFEDDLPFWSDKNDGEPEDGDSPEDGE